MRTIDKTGGVSPEEAKRNNLREAELIRNIATIKEKKFDPDFEEVLIAHAKEINALKWK